MNLSLLLSLCCQTGACSLCNPTDRSTLASGIHMGGKDSPSLCHWVDTFQGFYVAPSSAKTTSCLKAGFGTLASKWRECFIVGGGWGFFLADSNIILLLTQSACAVSPNLLPFWVFWALRTVIFALCVQQICFPGTEIYWANESTTGHRLGKLDVLKLRSIRWADL